VFPVGTGLGLRITVYIFKLVRLVLQSLASFMFCQMQEKMKFRPTERWFAPNNLKFSIPCFIPNYRKCCCDRCSLTGHNKTTVGSWLEQIIWHNRLKAKSKSCSVLSHSDSTIAERMRNFKWRTCPLVCHLNDFPKSIWAEMMYSLSLLSVGKSSTQSTMKQLGISHKFLCHFHPIYAYVA